MIQIVNVCHGLQQTDEERTRRFAVCSTPFAFIIMASSTHDSALRRLSPQMREEVWRWVNNMKPRTKSQINFCLALCESFAVINAEDVDPKILSLAVVQAIGISGELKIEICRIAELKAKKENDIFTFAKLFSKNNFLLYILR